MHKKISTWGGPLRSAHGYSFYRVDAQVDHDTHIDYGNAIITVYNTDEHADQNVNWGIGVNGWDVKRGHARTIRKAKAQALLALRRALGIGTGPRGRRYTSKKKYYGIR